MQHYIGVSTLAGALGLTTIEVLKSVRVSTLTHIEVERLVIGVAAASEAMYAGPWSDGEYAIFCGTYRRVVLQGLARLRSTELLIQLTERK